MRKKISSPLKLTILFSVRTGTWQDSWQNEMSRIWLCLFLRVKNDFLLYSYVYTVTNLSNPSTRAQLYGISNRNVFNLYIMCISYQFLILNSQIWNIFTWSDACLTRSLYNTVVNYRTLWETRDGKVIFFTSGISF